MKRMMKFGLALFFIVFVAPLWAHHAAEGIISDDIWQMIDDNLAEADSPHLNIDFDDVMGSMSATEIDGRAYLVTTITVTADDAAVYIDELTDVVNELVYGYVESDEAQVPDGILNNGNSSTFEYEVVVNEQDPEYVDIILYEPIGQGNSQTVPSADAAPGQRAGG